ncbi:MAG: MaoC family dehydratase [Gemmatimonadaceae bacterium]
MRFDELAVGMSAEMTHEVTDDMVRLFAEISGDHNPVHLDDAFAAQTPFGGRIAHGMLTASFISACAATKLPGPGAIYLTQTLRFVRPVRIGDTITTRVEVAALMPDTHRARMATSCRNQKGKVVLDGEAEVLVQDPKA